MRKQIGYVQKNSTVSTGGGSYKAVSHDVVTAMLRPHLIKAGIVVATTCTASEFDAKEDGSKQRLLRAEYIVSFINTDNPEDRLSVAVIAHALDTGEKLRKGHQLRNQVRVAEDLQHRDRRVGRVCLSGNRL